MTELIDPRAGIRTEEVLRLLRILNLPAGSYAVCGGALLAHHGLRINTNDIDLLVMPDLFETLSHLWEMTIIASNGERTPTIRIDKVRIEAFASINFKGSEKAIEYIQRHELGASTGIPLIRLEDMLEWKRLILTESPQCKRAREHQRDIDLIVKALA